MNISDLNHLEIISQTSSIRGGKSDSSVVSLDIDIVDGNVVEEKSNGLKKKVKTKGSTTTITYKGKGTEVVIYFLG